MNSKYFSDKTLKIETEMTTKTSATIEVNYDNFEMITDLFACGSGEKDIDWFRSKYAGYIVEDIAKEFKSKFKRMQIQEDR